MSMHDLIHKRELSLLTYETRQSVNALDGLLHDDFIEFGASGKTYNKSMILKDLPVEPKQAFALEDFKVTHLSEEAQLATYKLNHDSKYTSLRSSIWKKAGDSWQMIFHQGTKI